MQIIWKGQSCFQIITSQGKDSQVSLIIDPFGPECGLKVPNLSGDILLVMIGGRLPCNVVARVDVNCNDECAL